MVVWGNLPATFSLYFISISGTLCICARRSAKEKNNLPPSVTCLHLLLTDYVLYSNCSNCHSCTMFIAVYIVSIYVSACFYFLSTVYRTWLTGALLRAVFPSGCMKCFGFWNSLSASRNIKHCLKCWMDKDNKNPTHCPIKIIKYAWNHGNGNGVDWTLPGVKLWLVSPLFHCVSLQVVKELTFSSCLQWKNLLFRDLKSIYSECYHVGGATPFRFISLEAWTILLF